jgi:hypothetical protein
METIFTFIAGWLSTLSGVALGGFLVYRTKRDPYDPMFSGGDKGGAFNIDDDLGQDEPVTPEMSQTAAKANKDFMNQFTEDLTKI